jgi:hypothetical protein
MNNQGQRPFFRRKMDKWGHLRQSRSDSDKWGHLRGSRSDSQGVPIYPITIIAGHTHRPVFANLSLTERRCLEAGVGTPGVRRKEKADPVYYNTGSCVHPRCITGIEITAEPRPDPEAEGKPDTVPPAGTAGDAAALRPCFTLVKWGHQAGHEICLADGCRSYPLAIARTVLETG